MGDAPLVEVVDEVAGVGQGRGVSQVRGAIAVLDGEVHGVGRASSGADAGWVRFIRRAGNAGFARLRLRFHWAISERRTRAVSRAQSRLARSMRDGAIPHRRAA